MIDPGTAIIGSTVIQGLLQTLFGRAKYPKEIEMLLKSLSGKGLELSKGRGFDPRAVSAMYGKDFENVRAAGRSTRAATTETLGRAGMLGSGASIKAARQDAWQNENLVVNAIRDVFIANEEQKLKQVSLAQNILGGGVGAEVNRPRNEFPDLGSMVTMMYLLDQGKTSAIDPSEVIGTTAIPAARQLPSAALDFAGLGGGTSSLGTTPLPQSQWSTDFLKSLLSGWN